jgi:hypothetical protein
MSSKRLSRFGSPHLTLVKSTSCFDIVSCGPYFCQSCVLLNVALSNRINFSPYYRCPALHLLLSNLPFVALPHPFILRPLFENKTLFCWSTQNFRCLLTRGNLHGRIPIFPKQTIIILSLLPTLFTLIAYSEIM